MPKLKQRNLTEGPILSNLILYTIPIMLSGLLQIMFNAVDNIVVGWYCGSIYVAAVGSTGSIISLFVNIFMGFSVGASIVVAQAKGAQDDEILHKTVHTAIPVAVLSGIFLTIITFIFCEDILRIMGAPEEVLPLSAIYLKVYFCGITFSLLYNFSTAILRALGDTRRPLVFLAIAGVINMVLNILFVTVFDMNVAGVALATAISQGFAAVLSIATLMRQKDASRLIISRLRFYKEIVLKVLRLGVPTAIQSSLFSISNMIIQSSINSFGAVFVTGAAATNDVTNIVYTSMNAFMHTALNFTGQNIGAKKYDRVKKSLRICLLLVTVVGLTTGIITVLLGEKILGIYVKDSALAIEYGMIRMKYVALPYFLCGIMEVIIGAIRGMGSSFPPLIISIIGVCGIRLGWIFTIFKMFHTPEVLYLSYIVSWIITSALLYIVYRLVLKRTMHE